MNWLKRMIFVTGISASAYTIFSSLMARQLVMLHQVTCDETPSSVGLTYESVNFEPRGSDIELSGWIVLPPSSEFNTVLGKWLVMLHGFGKCKGDSSIGMLQLARDLNLRGYGLFLMDLRGSGHSQGDLQSVGYYERLDLLGALDFLARRGIPRQNTGVIGFSLGGAVAISTCANPNTAAAVVSDSSFADLMLIIKNTQKGLKAPLSVFNPGLKAMARLIYGIELSDISPVRSLSATDTPTMIIHGANDSQVPLSHARLLARSLGITNTFLVDTNNSLWIVPDSEHAQAYKTVPTEYLNRVDRFFSRHLNEN